MKEQGIPMSADLGIRHVSKNSYTLLVAVNAGGSVAGLDWTDAKGTTHRLFRHSDGTGWAGGALPSPGSFPMVPFANRIDGGRFSFGGDVIEVPVNRPETDVAIHGFSNAAPWHVAEETAGRLVILQRHSDPRSPYCYDAAQAFEITEGGVLIDLAVTNRADRVLPYGIGHHPWLERDGETVVIFNASGSFSADDRRLPIGPVALSEVADFREGLNVGHLPLMDACFAGWDGEALVEWRERGVRLRMAAEGALRILHVYVPDDQPYFCLEPVSHIPNVHNRRDLAAFGDTAALEPGQTLAGRVTLVVQSMP
jgi:aldose 1-epimerase